MSTPKRLFDFSNMLERVKEVFATKVKLGVITIVLNERKFIGASLRAVIKNPSVRKVVVVEGAVNLYPRYDELGLSTDGTDKEVLSAMNEAGGYKIVYDKYGFSKDKAELRNRALKLLPEDITHVLVVDADEVWNTEELNKLIKTLEENPRVGMFLFNFLHFWKNKDTIAVGSQWDSKMFRCFKFQDKTLHWNRHELPVVDDKGVSISKLYPKIELENVAVNHYGYMKDKQDVQDKIAYYKARDTRLDVRDTWSDWKEGMDTQPTHQGGSTVKFQGEHPLEVQTII